MKFYNNDREVDTLEEFLGDFIKELFDYAEYITELSEVKLNIISEELSNFIQLIAEGGEYRFNGMGYKVE